jgi:hypothetical protein
MSTIITALVILGFLGGVIGLLMYVHKRDQKKEAEKANL